MHSSLLFSCVTAMPRLMPDARPLDTTAWLSRRATAAAAAASALASPAALANPATLSTTPPFTGSVAAVAGGFLIPKEQYESYAAALDALGCATILFQDESTLSSQDHSRKARQRC